MESLGKCAASNLVWSDYYETVAISKGATLDDCDTYLLGETHNDSNILALNKKFIYSKYTPGSILLVEGIAHLVSANSVKLNLKNHMPDSLDPERLPMVGWDMKDYIKCVSAPISAITYAQTVFKRLLSERKVADWQSEMIKECASSGEEPESIVIEWIEKTARVIAEFEEESGFKKFMKTLQDIKSISSNLDCTQLPEMSVELRLINNIKLMELEERYSLEEGEKIVRKFNGLFVDLYTKYKYEYIEKTFPKRTSAMVHSIGFIHGTSKERPPSSKNFLIAGSAHLRSMQSDIERAKDPSNYSLDPLYRYIERSARKIAILVPRKLALCESLGKVSSK